jgi:signal transduction histidine kinase
VDEQLSGEALQRLVREHAALRRVATFVARQPAPAEVFAIVTREAGILLGARATGLLRVESPATAVMAAGWSSEDIKLPIGVPAPLDGRGLMGRVLRAAGPVRLDDFEQAGSRMAEQMQAIGVRSAVAGPVVIGGRIWGALTAAWSESEPIPTGAEKRVAAFAELVAYAIDNAETREALAASRMRLVEAADEQRRRVVRDLHDGAQQRLVHALITLQLANGRTDASPEVAGLIRDALEDTRAAIEELRELAHGIHPTLLTDRGLAAAVEALAMRAPVPVRVDIPEQRQPRSVEAAAYFVAAEALTNVAKYAEASTASITAGRERDALVLVVEDDGVGGAAVSPGGGLSGLEDRMAAFDGRLTVDSPPGAGTRIVAEIPLPSSDER